MADANFKFSVKIEKESLLKDLFTNIQHSTFTISTNFKILHILKKSGKCALNGAKLIILTVFFWGIYNLRLKYTSIIYMRVEYGKANKSWDFTI